LILNNGLLLDTNIISRFSPDRKEKSSEGLRKWLHIRAEAGTLYLSAITISEIERGMRKLHRSGGMKRAKLMNDWLESLTEDFGDRVLPVDCVVARIAAAMEDDAKTKGRHPGFADILIAATARAYGLTVITENIKHFAPLAVLVDFPEIFKPEDERAQIQTPRF
jgi:predicted nucleic acid-binding protein